MFLCSSLDTSDPTHASECREEARTRMADRGIVRMICVGSLKYASEEEEEEEEEEEKMNEKIVVEEEKKEEEEKNTTKKRINKMYNKKLCPSVEHLVDFV